MRSYAGVLALMLLAVPCGAQSDSVRTSRLALPVPQSVSEESHVPTHALWGAGIGLLTGLLVDAGRSMAAGTPSTCIPGTCQPTTELSPPFGTGMLIGTGAGLVVGAFVGWQKDRAVQVAPNPQARTLLLRADFRF